MTNNQQTELEAATLRKLLQHLDNNKQVQNIELMLVADFCRNCLSKWYLSEAQARNIELSDAQAREHIYKMPYVKWKQQYQLAATEEQTQAYEAKQASKQNKPS